MTTDAKQYVAIIGGKRIATSAAVVEHYHRAFSELPVQFISADADESCELPK